MEYTNEDLLNLRIYSIAELEYIHSITIFNRKYMILENHPCGCFNCLKLFTDKSIKRWIDDNTTAICPFCSVDSVLYQNDQYPLTMNLMRQMYKRYFESRLIYHI